jgi:hypothetical protein
MPCITQFSNEESFTIYLNYSLESFTKLSLLFINLKQLYNDHILSQSPHSYSKSISNINIFQRNYSFNKPFSHLTVNFICIKICSMFLLPLQTIMLQPPIPSMSMPDCCYWHGPGPEHVLAGPLALGRVLFTTSTHPTEHVLHLWHELHHISYLHQWKYVVDTLTFA